MDIFAILIARAKEDGQVGGLVPHLVDRVISMLQFVDDPIIFMENDLEKAVNMKLILRFFEKYQDSKLTSIQEFILFCQG